MEHNKNANCQCEKCKYAYDTAINIITTHHGYILIGLKVDEKTKKGSQSNLFFNISKKTCIEVLANAIEDLH